MIHIHNIISVYTYLFVLVLSIIMIFILPRYLRLGASEKASVFSKFMGYFYILTFTLMFIITFFY